MDQFGRALCGEHGYRNLVFLAQALLDTSFLHGVFPSHLAATAINNKGMDGGQARRWARDAIDNRHLKSV